MPLRTASAGLLAAVAERASSAHLAWGRAGAGTVMLARPTALPRLLGTDSATAARTGWAVQMLGAREVALGLGTVVALRRDDARSSRTWLAAGVLCDAVDALVVGAATARGRVPAGAGLAVVAVALSAVGLGARDLRGDDSAAG